MATIVKLLTGCDTHTHKQTFTKGGNTETNKDQIDRQIRANSDSTANDV